MEGVTLTRWRWRLRGVWLWPSFVALSLADAVIGHWLPPLGDSQSVIAAWILGLVTSLVAVVALSPPGGWLVRRVRGDMPTVVARDYAGTIVCVLTTLLLLAGGLAHRPVINRDSYALRDATTRAESYIDHHAPAGLLANQGNYLVYEVQPPRLYRVCLSAAAHTANPTHGSGHVPDQYCVVVDRAKPFGRSVTPAGSEPNALLSEGTG